MAKFGGALLSGGSSFLELGSGLVTSERGVGEFIFGARPKPETALLPRGFPPLMLTPIELLPAPLALASPGAPADFPSGEIETRPATLPSRTTTVAPGVPGVA